MRVRIAASIAALVLTGCSATSDASGNETRAAEAAAAAKAKAAARQAERQRTLDKCENVTRPLRLSLGELDSRLNIGLVFRDYGERLGDAQVAYDGLVSKLKQSKDDLSPCIDSAVALESALNAYVRAYDAWDSCIEDYDCDLDEGETNRKMQAAWAKGGRLLKKSERALAALLKN